MNSKLMVVLRALVIIALGIIVAIAGPYQAFDTYLAIMCLVGGIALLVLSIAGLVQTKKLAYGFIILSAILITISVAIFINQLTFAALVQLLIFMLMGLGIGMLIFGIYLLVRGALIEGLGQSVLGGLLILFTALYLGIPDFRNAFWIIVGVIIILYGALLLVVGLLPAKKQK